MEIVRGICQGNDEFVLMDHFTLNMLHKLEQNWLNVCDPRTEKFVSEFGKLAPEALKTLPDNNIIEYLKTISLNNMFKHKDENQG